MTQTASFLEHSFMLFGTDCNGTAARFTLMDCGFMRFQNTRRLFVSRCGHIACKMSRLLWVYEWKEALNADVIIEKTWKDMIWKECKLLPKHAAQRVHDPTLVPCNLSCSSKDTKGSVKLPSSYLAPELNRRKLDGQAVKLQETTNDYP